MTTHSQTKTEKLHHHHSITEENAKIFLKKKENYFREKARNTGRNKEQQN